MIILMGTLLKEGPPANLTEIETSIYKELQNSGIRYSYPSWKSLRFELMLRKNIIDTARALRTSGVEFAEFQQSKFNPKYWMKTQQGYKLRKNVAPSIAIEDIFKNGKEYSFECSTAIVVIYYYAVLQSISIRAFNTLFQNLLVWDWSYDEDLRIITKVGNESIPGDVLYFYNPDYLYPVWIGENTVYLGHDEYFGHGIGIGTKKEMINILNTLRKPGSTKSAYLLSQYSRLDFLYLSQFAS